MDFLNYREELGIGYCDEKKFKYFLNRLFNKLGEPMKVPTATRLIAPNDYRTFCDLVGIQIDYYVLDANPMDDGKRYQYCLDVLKEHSADFLDFLSYAVSFVNSIGIRKGMTSVRNREYYADILIDALKTAHIEFELVMEKDEYFIFPKGAAELDSVLISQPLEWLKDYPKSHKTYCIALRQYSEGVYIRDVADNLRKALEDFLREFLGNEKDLNGNKKEAETYLKQANANPQLVNMFGSLLTHYYLLNNDIAKHNDKVDKTYLEFLLYQTGIFIRMLIVVRQEYKESSHAD